MSEAQSELTAPAPMHQLKTMGASPDPQDSFVSESLDESMEQAAPPGSLLAQLQANSKKLVPAGTANMQKLNTMPAKPEPPKTAGMADLMAQIE